MILSYSKTRICQCSLRSKNAKKIRERKVETPALFAGLLKGEFRHIFRLLIDYESLPTRETLTCSIAVHWA